MKYQAYTINNYSNIPQFSRFSKSQLFDIELVSKVLPFRTNNYVVNELIDWNNFEEDPLYILNFPNKEMLREEHYERVADMLKNNIPKEEFQHEINDIRYELNPHPAGQFEYNVPQLDGKKLTGIQHKYRETILFFPSQGQSCHAYCTFCFRWPQFVGMNNLKFAMKEANLLIKYLRRNPQISDVLLTGGDPMVMNHKYLSLYINAILDANLSHIKTIRIGTKSLSFWPYRYLTDPDAQEILDLFKKVSGSRIHLAIMAHFNHYKELSTPAVQEAIEKIRQTGAQIRTQSPILRHINDSSEVWSIMWRKQVNLGLIPYYMFIARETGAQKYFAVPLSQALQIYRTAFSKVSGICRTVRGPSMSANPGKIHLVGTSEILGEKVFVLKFIQSRNPSWTGRPFFAKFNEKALWIDDLKPAFRKNEFFYSSELRKLLQIEGESYLNFDQCCENNPSIN